MKLEIDNVGKRYGPQWALKGLTLDLESFQCLALIGPSGGGKSTTLRLLAGLETPTEGSIRIDGAPIALAEGALRAYRKSIGVVFQAYNLFPHYTALQNIALPLKLAHGQTEEQANARANELLERFGLGEHGHKRPAQLSGGQGQRIAIARALAASPSMLLMDEPTSALDPEMTAEVLDVVEDLIRKGTKVIIVTHQMGFARTVADRVAIIAEGKILEEGEANRIFENPQSERARSFLNRVLKY